MKKNKEIIPLPQPVLIDNKQIIDQQIYQMIDRADEESIIEELSGKMTQKVCYQFEVTDKSAEGGKRIIQGIGFRGAMEIARAETGIGADSTVKPSGDIRNGTMFVTVFCRDLVKNVGIWGAGWQKMNMKRWSKDKGGWEEVEDPFAFIKAMNKAQRNGILALLGESVKEKYINLWKTQGKVYQLKDKPVEAEQIQNTPKPAFPEKTGLFGT